MLDLLYRSGFLKNGDKFSIDDCVSVFDFSFALPECESVEQLIVSFNATRSIGHYLGIQKTLKSLNGITPERVFVNQVFSRERDTAVFSLDGDLLSMISSTDERFGQSIHCCNLRINDVHISEFLYNYFGESVICLGMPAIKQHVGGPVSNLILKYGLELMSDAR